MAQQCKAKSKSTGQRCQRPVVKGFDVCRYHGGKSLTGTLNPAYRTGIYSRVAHATPAVREKYEAALSDPDIGTVRQDVAVVEMQIAELMATLPSGEGQSAWEDIEAWREKLDAARRMEPRAQAVAVARLLNEVGPLIDAGRQQQATRARLVELVQVRARLVETEAKLMAGRGLTYTAEQVMMMLGALADVMAKKHQEAGVDRRVTSEIGEAFRAIVDGTGRVLQ